MKLKNESGEEGEYNEYSSNHKAKVGVSLLAIILSDGLENLRFGYPQLQSLFLEVLVPRGGHCWQQIQYEPSDLKPMCHLVTLRSCVHRPATTVRNHHATREH